MWSEAHGSAHGILLAIAGLVAGGPVALVQWVFLGLPLLLGPSNAGPSSAGMSGGCAQENCPVCGDCTCNYCISNYGLCQCVTMWRSMPKMPPKSRFQWARRLKTRLTSRVSLNSGAWHRSKRWQSACSKSVFKSSHTTTVLADRPHRVSITLGADVQTKTIIRAARDRNGRERVVT